MSINGIEAIPGVGSLGGLNGAAGTSGYAESLGLNGDLSAAAVSGLTGSPQVGGTQAAAGPNASFGAMVTGNIERLEAMNDRTDTLAVKAATGDLGAIHEYTIAATETGVATQLAVTVRNKAIEAFNEIMRMPV